MYKVKEAKKQRSKEAKKQRSKEAKKQRSKEAKNKHRVAVREGSGSSRSNAAYETITAIIKPLQQRATLRRTPLHQREADNGWADPPERQSPP
jgi:hypothetical protein